MEVVEVAPPPPPLSCDLSPIAKGKRTKRLRPHSPIPFTVTSSEESSTTQEIDTARSLILLSQAHQFHDNHQNHTSSSQHDARVGGGGAFVYTCKTCNRSFPSFQALGGHRASHKKPKNEKRPIFSDDEDFPSPSSKINRFSLNSLSLQLNNNNATTNFMNKSSPSPRMHECSYCGAEFTSGQALGGHMRKHRAGPVMRSSDVNAPALEEMEPEDSRKAAGIINLGLSLDLNLPAPDEDKEKSPKESYNQRFRPGIGHRYYSTIN